VGEAERAHQFAAGELVGTARRRAFPPLLGFSTIRHMRWMAWPSIDVVSFQGDCCGCNTDQGGQK
jgi:hypothetical protein